MTEITAGGEWSGSPGLLVTKLHPPPRRPQTIARDRLVARLHPEAGLKLTLIVAPAGAGKTTLLSAWRDLEASVRPVAWMSLDEGDNDPTVLWSHLIEALRRVCPGLGDLGLPRPVAGARIVDLVLRRLVNELAEQGEVALILDDFHRLSDGEARDSVAWLVDHAPSTFQVVLATRSEPALPLAAMRAHGELLEVRGGELGFTSDEADALLNGRLELGLARDDVEKLVERTEGWPAGVYLAALSLQGVHDRHAFLSSFDGTSRHVVDFLVDEVLDAHDPVMQELMIRSSILERLCGSLCDAVLERDGTAELLSALSRTNLFLVPLDDRGEWYRFHHLFARLLRVELEHRHPGAASALHRRAYAWHRDHGSTDEAMEHAFEAGAFREAGELIATWHFAYSGLGRYATVLTWLQRLPRELVRENAQLLLVEAWMSSDLGKQEDAAQAIMAIEQLGGLDEGPLPDGFRSLESSLATLHGLFSWGDVGAAYESAARAVELEAPQSPRRDVACSALGYALYFRGEFDEADRWLAEAAELAQTHAHPTVASYSIAYRSFVAGDGGRLEDQMQLAEEALSLAAEHRLEDVLGDVSVAVGLSLAAHAQLEEALRLLERGVDITRSFGHPEAVVHGLIRQAAVLRAAGASEAARSAIAEARTIAESCSDLGILEERLAALEPSPREPSRQLERDSTLSRREMVVLRMLGGPLSERDIGRELYLSHNTIHSHTRSIYRKLGVSSRAEALERARTLGLL